MINHITPKMVCKAPKLNDIKDEIVRILNDSKLIVGYNHERFDIPFIESCTNKKIISKTCDVMKLFQFYTKNKKFQKLSVCCDYFGVNNSKEHDSLGDAKATLECFYKIMKTI